MPTAMEIATGSQCASCREERDRDTRRKEGETRGEETGERILHTSCGLVVFMRLFGIMK